MNRPCEVPSSSTSTLGSGEVTADDATLSVKKAYRPSEGACPTGQWFQVGNLE
ncbi:MAG: hypothetical protein ACYSRQ_06095 [Planctomycetota bacterium]